MGNGGMSFGLLSGIDYGMVISPMVRREHRKPTRREWLEIISNRPVVRKIT